MPYKYPSNIAEGIKGLPAEAQKTWIDIFNSAWEQYKDRDDQEALAAATAWAGLKRAGWKKDKDGNWVKTSEQGNLTTMELAMWEAYSQTYELKDVEVFSTGEWNKNKITDEDLDNIVNGTNEIINELKPKVKLGHDDKQKLLQASGLPAGGWITKLKKVGNKILVDIKEVPKVLYELIKNGAYKRVSSEILYDYTEPSTKKRYAKVLSAIAFLGGDLPAVTNLKDIAALYDDVNEEATLIIYEKKPTKKVENKKKGVEYIMVDGLKVTELEGKKFVAVEDYEKVAKEAGDNKDYKVKFEAEEKKSKDAEEKLNKISEEKRMAEIKTFVDTNCSKTNMKFLPKQKEILVALVESTSDEKTIKFTMDKKEVKLSQRELLVKFIELQPNFSDSIFAELSKDGEKEKEDDDKLTPEEKKVNKYMAENKGVTYRQAVLAVLKNTEEKKK
jgi:cation transport regulator